MKGDVMNAAPTIQFRRDPSDPIEVARAYLWKKNPAQAIPLLERALAENPDDGEAHHLLGCALIQTGNMEDARAHLQKSLDQNPENLIARLDLMRVARA